MLTYYKGEWKEEHRISNQWSIDEEGMLTYDGFTSEPILWLGGAYTPTITVYKTQHMPVEAQGFQYFVSFESSAPDLNRRVLVPDYPSLLRIIKEWSPLIQLAIATEQYKMLVEEKRQQV